MGYWVFEHFHDIICGAHVNSHVKPAGLYVKHMGSHMKPILYHSESKMSSCDGGLNMDDPSATRNLSCFGFLEKYHPKKRIMFQYEFPGKQSN